MSDSQSIPAKREKPEEEKGKKGQNKAKTPEKKPEKPESEEEKSQSEADNEEYSEGSEEEFSEDEEFQVSSEEESFDEEESSDESFSEESIKKKRRPRVSPGSKNSAIYLQKILNSKKYDANKICREFYLTIKKLLEIELFDLENFLLNLLQNLCYICPSIVSKKLLLALNRIIANSPETIDLGKLRYTFQGCWKNIEPEVLDSLFSILKFYPNEKEIIDYAGELWNSNYWRKSIFLAFKFNFSFYFENKYFVIDSLVEIEEFDILSIFISKDFKLVAKSVRILVNYKKYKVAEWIIEKAGYVIYDFPELIDLQWKDSVRYLVNKHQISIYQLISIISDTPRLLAYVAEELEIRGRKNRDSWQTGIAAGIAKGFPSCPIRGDIRKKLMNIKPRPIFSQYDSFGPLQPEYDISFPLPRNTIFFINSQKTLANVYFTGQIIGIDCEWKPTLVKYRNSKVSLIQIACVDFVYLIDLIALNTVPELDEKLTSLMQSDAYKVGVSFSGDIKELNSSYPHLKAFKNPLKNYIDLVEAYGKCFGSSPGGLAGCCELVLNKGLCKYEQMSNWENRPLTESQTHYAALDAYVQIVVLEEMIQNSGFDISEFIGVKNKYPTKGIKTKAPNCDFCGSKLHNKIDCSRGMRCKICYMTGHKVFDCF